MPFCKGYILGGGTALALQIAHRKSYDFDFFSQSQVAKNYLEKLSREFPIANIAVDSREELTFFTKSGVKVTFLHYPFGHAHPVYVFENGLQIFSVEDIAIKKAYTIGRRGEYRDYFDLYSILKKGIITLPKLIDETKKIYGSVFDKKIFLEQLVYFDDFLNLDIAAVDSNPVPAPDTVKDFFRNKVRDYLKT